MKKHLLPVFLLLVAGAIHAQDKPVQPIPDLLNQLSDIKTDTTRLHLLLTIADAYIEKPGEDRHDLDTALLMIHQVEKANAGSYIHDLCLLFEARANRERGDKALGKTYAFQALDAFRRTKERYPVELAYADYEAAKYLDYANTKENQQRVALYQEAVPLFEKTGRKEMQAATLQIMGDCMNYFSYGIDGLAQLLEAVRIYQSIGHTDLRDCYSLIGSIYGIIGDYHSALRYGLLALAIEDTVPLTGFRYQIYNRLGLINYYLRDFQAAANWFRKALRVAEQFHDTANIQNVVINVADMLEFERKYDSAIGFLDRYSQRYPFTSEYDHNTLVGCYAGIYISAKRMPELRPIVRELIHIDTTIEPEDFQHIQIRQSLLEYFLETRDFDKARFYIRRFSDFITVHQLGSFMQRPLGYTYKADSAQGRWNEAFQDYHRYIIIRDSNLDAQKTMQLKAMQLEYETEKKDRDIQTLTQKQQLSQMALHQASLTRDFIIGGSATVLVLLLFLLGVAINRYRLKQRSNNQLTGLLTEKDWLVKEIHHRVKNNLHMISGLLDSQAGYVKTPEAVSAIRESQHRVNAVSLVHQKLYQTNNLSTTDMEACIRELVSYLQASFASGPHIRFTLHIAPVHFNLRYSIPLCLILTEAVTNALKYAFPDGRSGEISIALQQLTGYEFLLSIADDGIGLSRDSALNRDSALTPGPGRNLDFAPTPNGNPDSMGMSLMRGLTEDLEGEFSILSRDGTIINISFPYDPASLRPAHEASTLIIG